MMNQKGGFKGVLILKSEMTKMTLYQLPMGIPVYIMNNVISQEYIKIRLLHTLD